jgi:hypothetical protein
MIPSLHVAAETVAQAEVPTSLIEFKTVLLIVVTVALYIVTRKLVGVHRRLEALETAKPFPDATSPKTNAKPADTAIPLETIAAISAAVHTTLRARAHILSIGQICPDRLAWSVEGRRQVFSSHKVR